VNLMMGALLQKQAAAVQQGASSPASVDHKIQHP
jgi:hypothetical protein